MTGNGCKREWSKIPTIKPSSPMPQALLSIDPFSTFGED